MPLPRWLARSNRYLANRIIGPFARYFPLMGVVHHVGRASGRQFSTPVNIFRDGGDYVIALTYTSNSDWVKNVLAAGSCEVETRGSRIMLGTPRLEIDQDKRWAPQIVRAVLNVVGVHEVLRLTSVP